MATPLTRLIPATLVAMVLIATGMSAAAAETTVPRPPSNTSTEAQNVGLFTGKFVDGMPVYRLPPLNVIGHRKVGLAKLPREEQAARSKQVRAKAVARGPA
jgi:hypothetical protein